MNWTNPGKPEVALVGGFIETEGPKISIGFAGSSQLDTASGGFVPYEPYTQLGQDLVSYIQTYIDKDVKTCDDGLATKIAQLEAGYKQSQQGFWHSLWHRAGNSQEVVEAWSALIPDSYGLAVVKTGIAVIFMLAKNSVEKQQRIFNTFFALREALIQTQPERSRFRSNQRVSDCADRLYKTVLSSIEEMVLLLTNKEASKWNKLRSRFKKENQPRPSSPYGILEKLEECTKEYQDSLNLARDQAIDHTQKIGQYTSVKATLIHHDLQTQTETIGKLGLQVTQKVSHVYNRVDQLASGATHVTRRIDEEAVLRKREHDERTSQHVDIYNLILRGTERQKSIAENQTRQFSEYQRWNRNLLLDMILGVKRMEAEVAAMRQSFHAREGGGRVSLERFCQILASPTSTGKPLDLDHIFEHPSRDLDQALAGSGGFALANQGQVQSLLTYERFHQWMEPYRADLILVDANIRAAALDSLSVISAFCATFATSLIAVHPDDVVIYFFCGLHAAPGDPWHGPNGLVRSLSVQLLMRLVEMNCSNLDFLSDGVYLQHPEGHDVDSMCATLYSLVSQFSPRTRIYCIIDSISCFDVDMLFQDLRVAMACLQELADRLPAPIFKVLLTTSAQSTLRMKNMAIFQENPSRLITLTQDSLVPIEISNRAVGDRLLETASPAHAPGREEGLDAIFSQRGLGGSNDYYDGGW